MSMAQAAVAQPAAAYHIRRVKTKLATGEYRQESVACFCGSSDTTRIIQSDRYGFDYPLSLCKRCGLLYLTPRMTAESWRRFYEEDYRPIYDQWVDGEEHFAGRMEDGHQMADWLTEWELKPKIVFDLGCHSVGILKAFQGLGATVLGVDYGLGSVAAAQAHGVPARQGGIEELEASGLKADLIICSHVVEHFLDLERDLRRLRDLLTDHGVVYLEVPGLYASDLQNLFQNAHTYQFTAETLSYVLECCGFEPLFIDQRICSLWQKADGRRSKVAVPQGEGAQIVNFLLGDRRRVPKIVTSNKFPYRERKANIKGNLALGLPDLHELEHAEDGKPAVIIGGGPSVDGQLKTIRQLKASGARLVTIERMLQWCLRHDLTPDYVITMDACDDVIEAFETLSAQPTYLLSTQCQPAVAERLKGQRIYLFNTPQKGMPMADLWDDAGYEHPTVLNGGGSVVLCAMSAAMMLGCKDLHVFGFDCHVTGSTYAQGITGVGAQSARFECEVGGRTFTTTPAYMSFAQQFYVLMDMAKGCHLLDSMSVYGDSLVHAMAKEGLNSEKREGMLVLKAHAGV